MIEDIKWRKPRSARTTAEKRNHYPTGRQRKRYSVVRLLIVWQQNTGNTTWPSLCNNHHRSNAFLGNNTKIKIKWSLKDEETKRQLIQREKYSRYPKFNAYPIFTNRITTTRNSEISGRRIRTTYRRSQISSEEFKLLQLINERRRNSTKTPTYEHWCTLFSPSLGIIIQNMNI